MAYPGVPTDTSVAFMERTTQMKVNARTSFFVGEGTWFLFETEVTQSFDS